jgi:oligosaccharide:H+ symporter
MNHSKLDRTGINLLMINAFIYITMSLYTPYLSSYYSKAGMNALEIGVLVTIGPVVAIFIQPLWAVISDRTGKKKQVLALVILGSLLSIYSYYIGKSFLTFFLASFLLAIFSTSMVPLSDAIILHSAHKHNFDFSKIRLGGTVGYTIFVIISGQIVKTNPDIQFFLGSIGYFLLLIVVLLLPAKECAGADSKRPLRQKKSLKERLNILNIFESKQIYFLLAFAFISQVGLSFNFSFLGVYMIKLGLNEGMIGIVNCIAALSEIPVLFLINRVLKRISPIQVTVIGCFFLIFRILFVTGESVPFLIMSNLIHGISFMTIYYSCAVFISKNVKPENQSQGQSILAIVQAGIGSIVGNILGGRLVDAYGLKPAYYVMAALVLGATIVILFAQTLYKKLSAANAFVE